MELIDIVNDDDEVIAIATREEADSNRDMIHRAVHFTLVNLSERKILLTQRSFSKSHDAGKICFLGEHLFAGETYEHAVIRGIQEELGVNVKSTSEISRERFEYDSQIELVRFYLSDTSVDEFIFDKNELEDVFWVDLEELKSTSLDISDMTQHWIDTTNWQTFFK